MTDVYTIPDIAPETGNDSLACETCGKELTYSGRGRKPRYCPEHKRGNSDPAKPAKRSAGNSKAEAAAAVLSQANMLASLGLLMLGLPVTAETLRTAQDSFVENARTALETDPALCAKILTAGTASSLVALCVAYASMGAIVIPVGISEVKALREAKAEANAETVTADMGY